MMLARLFCLFIHTEKILKRYKVKKNISKFTKFTVKSKVRQIKSEIRLTML